MKINFEKLIEDTQNKTPKQYQTIDEDLEYENILFDISKTFLSYRKENNMTQSEFARKVKVKQVMVSKLESGSYNPTIKLLHKISRKLNHSSEFLVRILEGIIKELKHENDIDYQKLSSMDIAYYTIPNHKKDNVINLSMYLKKEGGKEYGKERYKSKIPAIR